jgi:glutaredoxin
VKEFLSRAGAPFTAFNVDEDDRAYDDLLARGFRMVPVTIVGGHAVKGYDADALASAVAEWRASATPHER